MSPEQFVEHMVTGIQSMALPILLYLLTICFSTLLEQQAMSAYFDTLVEKLVPMSPLMPAMLFLVSTVFTVLLGSSWAMFAIAFPVAVHVSAAAGVSLPLCIGAVCAAGIAGEKNCTFTSDSLSVGNAIGCDPGAILRLRLPYSLWFTGISLLLYLAAGFLA
jgi:Na+/H+ antiporter NhaC